MRKILSISWIIFIAIIVTGCSKNHFTIRKNYQPRIKVEVNNSDTHTEEKLMVLNNLTTQKISFQYQSTIQLQKKTVRVQKPKETILEKMVNVFAPRKKDILAPVLHPQKKPLGVAKTSADDRTVGLILNLLSVAFAITALLLIIGMAHGNVWVCFTVGMVFAIAAIILGFVGKLLPWRGFGLFGLVLGILAVMALLVFLLLITVVHIVF